MNNLNITSIQVLFSAVFIFTGIIVFYVASLISGHNIYRDLEFQHSSMLSVVVGSILFLLLPIGYIIFMPDLFDLKSSPIFISDTLWLSKPSPTEFVISIHKILIEKALFPFILVAAGLGVVFGCTTTLKSRWEILRFLRKCTGVSFYISSYDFTWDHFLMFLKKHALIAVELGDGSWIKGYMGNRSIKKEPKQLVLKSYQIAPEDFKGKELQQWLEKEEHDHGEELWTGQMLITEADGIKKVAIYGNSLKKHSHAISHTTQAAYCSLLAFGFLLLFSGLHCTYELVHSVNIHNNFNFLEAFYCNSFWLFFIFSLISLVVGLKLLKTDYPSWQVAMVLNCTVTFFFGFIAFIISIVAIHFYFKIQFSLLLLINIGLFLLIFFIIFCIKHKLINLLLGSISFIITIYLVYLFFEIQLFLSLLIIFGIGLPLLIIFITRCFKRAKKIKMDFKKIYDDDKWHSFSQIITYLYDEMNLNTSDTETEYNNIKNRFLREIAFAPASEYRHAKRSLADELFKKIELLDKDLFSGADKSAKLNIIVKLEKYCTLWGE